MIDAARTEQQLAESSRLSESSSLHVKLASRDSSSISGAPKDHVVEALAI
jgi:hypothetical protein